MLAAFPPPLPLEELRRRVQEAEKLLRVAKQLARDELRDPKSSERAKERIAALCHEVSALFPGVAAPTPGAAENDEDASDPELEDAEEPEEYEVDYEKLRSAIENPLLMGGLPESDRAQFKALALQLLDAHDRQELFGRVTAAFQELEQTTRAGEEEVRRLLALTLTFEGLRARSQA